MSHVLTPNNSSIKSRGPVGEEQADVSEQLLNLTVDVTEISEAVHRQSRKLAELVCELINYYWLFCCCWCLFTWVYFLCVFLKLIKTQLSQAHIMRVWNVIYFLTRESVSHYKRPLRSCMRNKILRSANAKYHYILPFFYQINKGDLLLKYLCVFWCEFMDLVNFFALLCDPWHSIRQSQLGCIETRLAVLTLSTWRWFVAWKPTESQTFSTRGKVLYHRYTKKVDLIDEFTPKERGIHQR